MKPPFWERFKNWICTVCGHKFYPLDTVRNSNRQDWEYNGARHRCCQRCGHIISTPLVVKPEPGSKWFHRNQNLYRVHALTTFHPARPQYPEMVIYQSMASGNWYARPLSDWYRSMTPA